MAGQALQTFSKHFWIIGFLLWLGGQVSPAQSPPDGSVADSLRSLNARAATAFVGEVLAVRALGSVVEVQFRVDQPLKGVPAGSFVLREWSGLWAARQRRYWVGERALVFLNAPAPNGVTSPVDGMDGVLPVSSTEVSAAPAIDVRRVSTRVLREAGAPIATGEPVLPVASLQKTLSEPPGPVAAEDFAPGPAWQRRRPVRRSPPRTSFIMRNGMDVAIDLQ